MCSVKKVFLKFREIHRKEPVLEFLFNKASDFKVYNFIKKRQTLAQVFSFEFRDIFRNIYFVEHLGSAASYNISLKTKKLDRDAAETFTHHLRKKKRYVMFRSYKNRIAKNKCLEILPELFAVSGKKGEYRIHLTDSSVPIYLFIFNLFIVDKFNSTYNQTILPQTARPVSNLWCNQQHCRMLESLTPDI